ncbi:DoxX family membrane protein [Cohaesibacter sp. CAU 1516]|uniref:DoxX family membrane protein n=1 Tax=Cohaesibacter sp. CAU 1516 TaxID=2576038 RepID=UPI0010FDFA30|nr:DoxX family membrane protein [Cohaesibacter sp. CAU 1516]TLP48386.1 DoxX family membrane protein [Cohaesibacter sp. CAU 1516]
MSLLDRLIALHNRTFSALDAALSDWFLGLAARLIFSSALFFYYFNSGISKLGEGFFGIFNPSAGAYGQILPTIAEAVLYDTSQIAFFPWTIIVILGTVTEIILPFLILFGLVTRLASLAFIGFIAVQTYVDIAFHGLESETIGAVFDQVHNSEILDYRLLSILPLILLILKGPGKASLDYLLTKTIQPSGKLAAA